MKSAILAAVAVMTTVRAAKFNTSPYFEDWHSVVPGCWYDDPVDCQIDGECGEGYVCFQNFCYDVRKYFCEDDCPTGMKLNPLRYCECIDDETLLSMFCEPSSGTSSSTGNN